MKFLRDVRLIAILFVTLLVIGGVALFVMDEHIKRSSPETAAREAFDALHLRHMRKFKDRVDLDAVADSIITQTFPQDSVQAAADQNILGQAMLKLIKPSLTKLLAQQVEDYIATGEMAPMQGNIPNLLNHVYGLISKTGTPQFSLSTVEKTNKGSAVAVVTIQRPDLGITADARFYMKRTATGWHVVGIDAINELIQQFVEAEADAIKTHNTQVEAEMTQLLQINTAKINRGSVKEGSPATEAPILLTTAFENTSDADVFAFSYTATIMAGDGTVLKTLSFDEANTILSKSIDEKTHPLQVDAHNQLEKLIFELPLTDITVHIQPTALELSDGRQFELK